MSTSSNNRPMKKFNQVITVEVEVDTIANQFLQTLKEDNPHRVMITEAVIGTSLNTGKISQIYNALNGHSQEVDFEVGQQVTCSAKVYDYKGKRSGYREIGEAKITDIDPYREDKLCLEYDHVSGDGEVSKNTTWVSHRKCNPVNSRAEKTNGVAV